VGTGSHPCVHVQMCMPQRAGAMPNMRLHSKPAASIVHTDAGGQGTQEDHSL